MYNIINILPYFLHINTYYILYVVGFFFFVLASLYFLLFFLSFIFLFFFLSSFSFLLSFFLSFFLPSLRGLLPFKAVAKMSSLLGLISGRSLAVFSTRPAIPLFSHWVHRGHMGPQLKSIKRLLQLGVLVLTLSVWKELIGLETLTFFGSGAK